MARDHLHSNIQRRNRDTRQARRIILFVEGRNTEPSYFDLLKRSNCTTIPVTVPGHGIASCVDFVEEVNVKFNRSPEKIRAKYAQKWMVFDCDGHEDFSAAIRKAKEYGFRVVFSNMCIEYWFMLHFYNHSGEAIPLKGNSHSQAQIDEINRFIKSYNKKNNADVKLYDCDGKLIEEDFFDLMLAIDPTTHQRRIEDACERAENIHLSKKHIGAEFRESVTNMYELMIELGVVKKIEQENGIYKYVLNS